MTKVTIGDKVFESNNFQEIEAYVCDHLGEMDQEKKDWAIDQMRSWNNFTPDDVMSFSSDIGLHPEIVLEKVPDDKALNASASEEINYGEALGGP